MLKRKIVLFLLRTNLKMNLIQCENNNLSICMKIKFMAIFCVHHTYKCRLKNLNYAIFNYLRILKKMTGKSASMLDAGFQEIKTLITSYTYWLKVSKFLILLNIVTKFEFSEYFYNFAHTLLSSFYFMKSNFKYHLSLLFLFHLFIEK